MILDRMKRAWIGFICSILLIPLYFLALYFSSAHHELEWIFYIAVFLDILLVVVLLIIKDKGDWKMSEEKIIVEIFYGRNREDIKHCCFCNSKNIESDTPVESGGMEFIHYKCHDCKRLWAAVE